MSNTGSGAAARGSAAPVDVATAVRAASTGLSVLLLGGLLTPLAQMYVPVLGQFWLLLVSVAAFATAGSRVGDAELAHVHGACAALGSFLLVLPLVFWFPPAEGGIGPAPIVSAAGAAVVVGALAGHLAGRRRDAAR